MYSFDAKIRYSECGRDGRLSWEGLLNLFQDCSSFQSEDLGVGIDFLQSHHRAWVLNYWQIEINRFPAICENVTVTTVPYEIKGFFGMRNFVLRSAEEPPVPGDTPDYMRIGDTASLAYANSLWTFLDLDTIRPARVTEPWISAYRVSERIPMEYGPRKIALPPELEPVSELRIMRHHLDTNGHVNNARYVSMGFDALEEFGAGRGLDFSPESIRKLRVEYRRAAYLGDVIRTKACMTGSAAVVSMEDENGRPFAVLEAHIQK